MNRHTGRKRMIWLAVAALLVGTAAARSLAGEAVTVREETLTLPWFTGVESQQYDFRYGNCPCYCIEGTQRACGKRDLRAVILENRYLRITVLPEVGGAVGRVIYKPTGDDLFFWEGRVKAWTPFWESGVKVNFPAVHHCVHTSAQPASWRVVRRPDGSVTVAMWMEFSRFNEWYHGPVWGRYTTMLLSHHVTLRPGCSVFEDTTRLVNPSAYPQGRRVWNDALFPRNHTPNGVVQGAGEPPAVTDTEWIYPAHDVSGHQGQNFRRWSDSEAALHGIANLHNSVFSWAMPYGFAGLWYPSVKVNRLRLCDPAVAPGAKQYFRGEGSFATTRNEVPYEHMYNFIELFGGPDNIQEGVENWIEPGECFQYTHRYTLVKGIGKVDFANEDAAVNVEMAGDAPRLEAVTFGPVDRLTVTCNGKPLAAGVSCGPETPLTLPLPRNLDSAAIELTAGGRSILKQIFPLKIPENANACASIRAALNADDLANAERFSTDTGIAAALQKSGETNTVRGGRILYRLGRLKEAEACLQAVVKADPGAGEGWYYLGLVRQDLAPNEPDKSREAFTNALAAARPYSAAHYFAALDCLHIREELRQGRAGKQPVVLIRTDAAGYADAEAHLEKLITLRPNHLEGRLLKAWLECHLAAKRKDGLEGLKRLDAEDPADPRIQMALVECADLADDEALAAEARRNLQALSTEPGAWRRLSEFEAATRGIFVPPRRQRPHDPQWWYERQ